MSGDFWGMTTFLITTIIFSVTTLVYARKLAQARRCLCRLSPLKPRSKAQHSHSQQKQETYNTKEAGDADIVSKAISGQGSSIKKENPDPYTSKPRLKAFHSSQHKPFLPLQFIADDLYNRIPLIRRVVRELKQGPLGGILMAFSNWLYEERPDIRCIIDCSQGGVNKGRRNK